MRHPDTAVALFPANRLGRLRSPTAWLVWAAISNVGCGARTGLALASAPAVRQIFPLSTARVTSQRPTLRWELHTPADGAHIEVCPTRDCSVVEQSGDVSGASFRAAALAPGIHYWRLQAERDGARLDAKTPTWEFFVPERDTGTDTAWGSILDPDGDGHADAIVVPLLEAGQDAGQSPGCVALYSGSESGLHPDRMLAGPAGAGGQFGASAASAGDVNGDGYGDVVVGAICDPPVDPGQPIAPCSGPGRAYVYFGGPTGLAPSASSVVDGTAPQIFFGEQVGALGDVNGDGYGDFFVVSSVLSSTTAHQYPGSVTVVLGGPEGPVPANVIEGPEREDFPEGVGGATTFGAASAGDLNGDGYDDLLVATWCSEGVGGCRGGSVQVYLGSRESIAGTPDLVLHDSESDDPRIRFGGDISSGLDLNGDGFADFLVGAVACTDPGCAATGRVDVFLGGPSGPQSRPDLAWLDPNPSVTDADGYGASLVALGDVNGDGFDDGLVNVPTCGPSFGAPCASPNLAYVYDGADPASAVPSQTILAPDRSSAATEDFAFFGAPGDIDGDGIDDATAGAIAFAATEPRSIYTFRGSKQGLPSQPTATVPWPVVDSECR